MDIRGDKDPQLLMRVALGQEPADLAVIDADLVNVYSGEVLTNQSVAVKGAWIAAVGPRSDMAIGPHTHVIDAAGRTLIPGLIDGHAHLAWYGGIDQLLHYIMPGGTTSVISETMEVFPVAGMDGVLDFMAACRQQPVKIFTTAPFMASISEATRGIAPDSLKKLVARPDVVGLGESYWQSALQHLDDTIASMAICLSAGKTVEGHSAGARGPKLTAYALAGASSCHEPISPEEILERLRLGLYVMVREGSIRQDLGALVAINDMPIDHRRLILVTDGVTPADLMTRGYLEHVVQKAIDAGIAPMRAICMATLNVAEHFGLDDIVGGIAPGRCADMLLIPDIHTIDARCVISNGRMIAEDGRLLVAPRRHSFSGESLNTIHLPRPLAGDDFVIHGPAEASSVRVRVIQMVTDLVSREEHVEMELTEGRLAADPGNDLVKVAAIDRRFGTGRMFVGLLGGFGLSSGAVACSAAWDTADIIAVGLNDNDLAAAVNRVAEMQGGLVLCEGGRITGELSMPVFGILSQDPLVEIAATVRAISKRMSRLGCPFPDPLLSLEVLTGAAIPFLRICEAGLVNLKDGATKGLFLSSALNADQSEEPV